MAWFSDMFPSHASGEGDDWGSDFEEAFCSQEIEDNKINEIREANFLKNAPNNVQDLTEENSQAIQTLTKNRCINAIKTGAIPKSGFSYLNNIVETGANRSVHTIGKQTEDNIHLQRQVSKPTSQSSNPSTNSENSEKQPQTQGSINDAITKNIPRKLKPEVFSFLNKLPQRNVTENDNDVNEERQILISTNFSHAEESALSQSRDDAIIINEGSDELFGKIPLAPPKTSTYLENATSNYETITEDSLSEFVSYPASSILGKENVMPPLPLRPPPVFKYALETFSSSKSTSVEYIGNPAISQPLSQSSSSCPKLNHSISSTDSDLKHTSEAMPNRILSSKESNRRSFPSVAICPAVPKRPLPPLPISDTENVSRIKSQGRTDKLVNHASVNNESWLEEAPEIHGTISSRQTNQLSICEVPIQHTPFKESALQEQLISNPQQRLTKILTNQTSVDSAVLLSQHKIASAITSRATGSQTNSISSQNNTEESEFQNSGKPQELIKVIPRKSLENDVEQKNGDKLERQSSYLEAEEVVNIRRFPDHETLINSMDRPVLPQKAAPIQRSVSCNSLVQSIKDLSFSVWSKPEKKRNSDGISIFKKSPKSILAANSSKVKCTAPLSITLIPTDAPIEVINPHHGKGDGYPTIEKSALQEYPWFHDVDAKEGQLRLLKVGLDGTFLIRPSSRPTNEIQNTLCILYNKKIRNLHIRRTPDGQYVLGTKSNKNFSSLADMIRHHKEVPVEILPQGSTPIKPQLYRILLRETPPKQQ